jgi:putative transposase
MRTLDDVAKKFAEQKAAVELVRLAQEHGLSLTGPDGLLNS